MKKILLILFAISILGCTQSSQSRINASFIFHDAEGPVVSEFSEELGINTVPMYLGHLWRFVEPSDDEWDVSWVVPHDFADYDHIIVRFGIIAIMAWSPSDIPSWVDTSNETEFKNQYLEYVRRMTEYIKSRGVSVDLYLVELESNIAGTNMGRSNTWIIEWIKDEVNTIKSVDPNAKICIPLTPTDLRPGQVSDEPDDWQDLLATDFARRMINEGVDFDVIGFNIASGAYDDVGNWTVLEEYLEEWDSFGKEIFIWAMGYPADNDDNLSFNYPREGGYSEEWQEEMYINSMRLLLDDPKVMGVSIDLYDFLEPEFSTPFHWGLIGGNRSEPETLFKRPAFDAVKQYWLENYR
jgi:hypothetical protein